MYPSKVFDTLNHNLKLAKLNVYRFSFSAIKFIQSYFSGLGPILFNIFINGAFYFIQDAYICTFGDDNSSYSIEDNFKEVLKNIFEILQGWFYENHRVLNPGKYHYVIINKDIANESTDLGKKT